MKVLYHLTIPPPKMPHCEAVWKEIDALRRYVGGEIFFLNPSQRGTFRLPRLLFGLHALRELRRRERDGKVELHHVFNPDPYPFPVLRWLSCPVVYTLTGGVRGVGRARVSFFARHVHTLVVASDTGLHTLAAEGLSNCRVIRPGIDGTLFSQSPLPLSLGDASSFQGNAGKSVANALRNAEIRLMVGSAPWVKGQFRSKGIDTLLDVAQKLPRLHLVFLWRGVLYDAMVRRVRQRGLDNRVQVLNRKMDVNEVLKGVHASVVLAEDPAIVRAFPHSLMESLAAAKPVLISRGLPLADIVAQSGCGRIVESVTPMGVVAALEDLVRNYENACQQALTVGQNEFSQDRMVMAHRDLYESIRGEG
jgi:glycosyltransferase involved in cell wall biosynthesis